ncbi:hypothetical protein [Cohnella panacarvi]|uniref:hypothetical protein n=1 Tax=Cohnella panacarvi TaxID=400776 RepID=UPI000478C28E|nr:hypothetical protein [Cohnella panacarvi]
MKKGILALICCLLMTACGDNPRSSKVKPAYKPTLNVKLDLDGNKLKVTVDTDMHISPEHYGMQRKEGEGHIHMYLDDQARIGVKENIYEFPPLAPGRHTIKVSLHNNDHTPYDVTVKKEFDIQ